jgi:nucleoside-triphosphatase THEP1
MEKAAAARMYVLTGPVHAGKTSFLRHFLQNSRKQGLRVNGILSLAAFQGPNRIGYDAHDLRSGDSWPLLRTDPDPGWLRVGPFGMCPEGLEKAQAAILDIAGSDLTVIDEMGPLELAGRGFWPCFQTVIKGKRPVLVVVRSDLVSRFQEALDEEIHVFRLHAANVASDLRSHLDYS